VWGLAIRVKEPRFEEWFRMRCLVMAIDTPLDQILPLTEGHSEPGADNGAVPS
jgi:hypothetical protein